MKSKQLETALEFARTHILKTGDTAVDAVEKFWKNFDFDEPTLEFLAKKGFVGLLTADLRAPSRDKFSRVSEIGTRAATPVEYAATGHSTTTFKQRPFVTVKPSKLLTNISDQILNNVSLEGANGRRVLLRDFTLADCKHYDKTQSFIVEGIERKRQVVANIQARLKHYKVSRVSELPPREQTFTAREWKNAEKGVEPPAFAAAAAVGA